MSKLIVEIPGQEPREVEVADPAPPTPEEIAQAAADYNLAQNENRRLAFITEADPLYLNETEHAIAENRAADYSVWLAKKAEIRERFPYA